MKYKLELEPPHKIDKKARSLAKRYMSRNANGKLWADVPVDQINQYYCEKYELLIHEHKYEENVIHYITPLHIGKDIHEQVSNFNKYVKRFEYGIKDCKCPSGFNFFKVFGVDGTCTIVNRSY